MIQMYKVFFDNRVIILTNNKPLIQNEEIVFNSFDIQDMEKFVREIYLQPELSPVYLYDEDVEKLWHRFRNCFKEIKAAGGLVKNNEGNVLMIFRREKWDLPKGKVDKNEETEHAALREVSEECGIEHLQLIHFITNTFHFYFQNDKLCLKETFWFDIRYAGEEAPVPQTEEDITEVVWIPPDRLNTYMTNSYPLVREVLQKGSII